MTLQLAVDPEGFAENVADRAGLIKHRTNGDLKRFKEYIESVGMETGAWRGEVNPPQP
ncbi:MAG: putative integral rane protein [Streptosporangiaceae bacterium]|nr:putative integral rane protein [Streptosporangiaceae bacterium]